MWALFGLSTLAVAFRFIARLTFLEGNLGWDDWVILLAYGCVVPTTVIGEISEHA